jgi:hypothetical protein
VNVSDNDNSFLEKTLKEIVFKVIYYSTWSCSFIMDDIMAAKFKMAVDFSANQMKFWILK